MRDETIHHIMNEENFGNNNKHHHHLSLAEGKLRSKIDLVSYPAQAEGMVNMIIIIILH